MTAGGLPIGAKLVWAVDEHRQPLMVCTVLGTCLHDGVVDLDLDGHAACTLPADLPVQVVS